MNITLSKNDEIVMKLIHYFITEKGYNPIILHGAKDEIWLENNEEDYQIVRIVTNYIHNKEQLDFDLYRAKTIMKKIGHKTFTFNMNALSIFVNLGDNVNINDSNSKNIDIAYLQDFNDINKYSFIKETFPDIIEHENTDEKGLELFMKITEEINEKNTKEAQKAEDVFARKTPYITYTLIAINVIVYILLALQGNLFTIEPDILYKFGGLVEYSKGTDYTFFTRLVTSMFLHGGIIHLGLNMYCLYVIGPQLESFYGKIKYTIIYFLSGIIGGLFTLLFINGSTVSIGASGAIFGLLGALLYFGYHYRIYLGEVMRSQIIPLIIINVVISFIFGFNNVAHLGGLFGGYLAAKACGVKYKSETFDIVNGIIMLAILVAFLGYMILGR